MLEMSHRRPIVALSMLLLAVVLAAPGVGRADCEDPARAADLAASLAQGRGRARTWRFGWTAVNGALAVGSAGLLPLTRRSDWPDLVVGGAASALSAIVTVLTPLDVEGASLAAARLAGLPPCARLARLESLAAAADRDERARVTWPWHLLNLGLAAVVGAVLVLGFEHWEGGALNAGATFVLGELQLFTQPTP